MKPDWFYAPEWAQWLAQDVSGAWHWFEFEPKYDDFFKCWSADEGSMQAAYENLENKSTLEKRQELKKFIWI